MSNEKEMDIEELYNLNPGFSFLEMNHIIDYVDKTEEFILAVFKRRIRPTNKTLYYIPELFPIIKDIKAGKYDSILDAIDEEEH